MAALLENNSQTKQHSSNILQTSWLNLGVTCVFGQEHVTAFLGRKASGPFLCMKCQGKITKLTEKLQG